MSAMEEQVNYLRISVTDLCNLRCIYCMPPAGIKKLAHGEVLSFEEIVQVVEAALRLGITRYRLTGGEPLVRHGVFDLIGALASLPGIEDLSITTNGLLLSQTAVSLK